MPQLKSLRWPLTSPTAQGEQVVMRGLEDRIDLLAALPAGGLLAEQRHREAHVFGQLVLDTLEALDGGGVRRPRRSAPGRSARATRPPLLAELRTACKRRQHSDHTKTHALAVELLNDWEAIFQVLVASRNSPLTNNAAERALRHWVILRKLSLGTRTPVGSRVVALLASVIDTCRQRGHSPWRYLERAIADRRAGQPLAAALPQ